MPYADFVFRRSTVVFICCFLFILPLAMNYLGPYTQEADQNPGRDDDRTAEVTPLDPAHDPKVDKGSPETRGADIVLLSENFDSGWGVFQHGVTGGAFLAIAESVDGNSVARSGSSVFMAGAGDNNVEQVYLFTTLDLRGTGNVFLDFHYAYEDIEWNEHLYVDIDDDGNHGNGFNRNNWKTAPARDDNDHRTSANDYIHQQYDLTNIQKRENVRIRFRAVIGSHHNYDLFCLDDVLVKVNYVPDVQETSVLIDPVIIYTLTHDTAALNVTFLDADNHDPGDFQATVDVRLADNSTVLRYLDNASKDDYRVNVESVGTSRYNATFFFDPNDIYGFGQVDLKVMIFDPDGFLGTLPMELLENAVELRDHWPALNVSTFTTDHLRRNLFMDRSLKFTARFDDMDNQSIEDFNVTLYVRDEDNTTYELLNRSDSEEDDLEIKGIGHGNYEIEYTWTPADDMPVSIYDAYLSVGDGYGAADNVTFQDGEGLFELYEVDISDISASPEPYNRHSGEALYLNLSVSHNISGPLEIWDPYLNLSLRDAGGAVYNVTPPARGDAELEIINTSDHSYIASLPWNGANSLPNGEFDARAVLFVGNDKIFVSTYADNPGILNTFYNVGPSIRSVTCSPGLVNSYVEPVVTITVEFIDPDLHEMEMFSFDATIRDAEGREITLLSGATIDSGAIDLTGTDDTYSAEITFMVRKDFIDGEYDVEVTVSDAYNYSHDSSFAEGENLFEVYSNVPPSTPVEINPSETRELSPMIHWSGASDAETESHELEYFIRIGTGPGAGDVLDWYSTGRNPFYQVDQQLEYGVYSVAVMATDGQDNSTPFESIMEIYVLANLPPFPPNRILPDYTIETLPKITWSGASDGDGDAIMENHLQIGTKPLSNDTLPWVNVGTSTYYQIQEALPFGTYYVQVKVSDGKETSFVRQELMHVVGEGNAPPSPPTELYPTVTWDTTPKLTWVGAYDINNDTLTYSIQIGTALDMGDILPWNDGLVESQYQIGEELEVGRYYVQIKTFDGELYSQIFQSTLDVTEVGNMPPGNVSNIRPTVTTNTTPTIYWDPASDPDGDDSGIIYLIQIGLSPGHGEVLQWISSKNRTSYTVTQELTPNRIYYVQIKAFDGEGYSPVIYSKLEILVYITEIAFLEDVSVSTVEKGTARTFTLRVVNRGTIRDNVTLTFDVPGELEDFVNTSGKRFSLAPEEEIFVHLRVHIPEKEKVLGDYAISARCVSEAPDFFSVTEEPLLLSIVAKPAAELPFLERMLDENRETFIAVIAILALIILLIVVLLMIRRRKARIPRELLNREADFSDAPEVTFAPAVSGGVVAKRIFPEAEELFGKGKEQKALPAARKGDKKSLPAPEKKRLALPQYSVVIDMHSKQVIGQSETDELDMDKKKDEEEDFLEFQFVNGKYELATPGLPPEQPYGKAPGTSVPTQHPYKHPPTPGPMPQAAPQVSQQPAGGTEKPPSPAGVPVGKAPAPASIPKTPAASPSGAPPPPPAD